MNKKLKDFQSRQQVKDEQINYLLADVEEVLEECKFAFEQLEKTIMRCKKDTAFCQAKLR